MSFRKPSFKTLGQFLAVTGINVALVGAAADYKLQLKQSEAARLITSVKTSTDLRSSCRDLIVSDALIVESSDRAERAKRICEEEYGL